jgi:hypothetical protein
MGLDKTVRRSRPAIIPGGNVHPQRAVNSYTLGAL